MADATEIPEFELPEACSNVEGMKAWVEGESVEEGSTCRPCTVPIGARWYYDTLVEFGQDDLAEQLKEVMEQPDIEPLQLAEHLDIIKDAVDPNLVNRLKEFDCEIQVNAEALSTEVQNG